MAGIAVLPSAYRSPIVHHRGLHGAPAGYHVTMAITMMVGLIGEIVGAIAIRGRIVVGLVIGIHRGMDMTPIVVLVRRHVGHTTTIIGIVRGIRPITDLLQRRLSLILLVIGAYAGRMDSLFLVERMAVFLLPTQVLAAADNAVRLVPMTLW